MVSGIEFDGENGFTPVGQQFGTNPYNSNGGYTAYGGRFEFAFFPQAMPSTNSPVMFQGGTLSTGVSTIDMSLVNGFNFSFLLYPTQPTICAFAEQENGPPHYNMWGFSIDEFKRLAPPEFEVARIFTSQILADNIMSAFVARTSYCPSGQAVTVTVNRAKANAGCQSDATYASNTNSEWASAYGCTGSYATAQTCPPPASDPPPYNYTPASPPPGSPVPWRPYSQNLGIGQKNLYNAYTWPYEDFRGTFTCDGNAKNYTLVISDPL